jgi:transposase
VTCPVVTEAVKAATPESRIAMALVAIETEKISQRAAAQKFGVAQQTLSDRINTDRLRSVITPEVQRPAEPSAGKDGVRRHPPAAPELISKAWELKDAGGNTAEIARELERSWPTVNRWLSRPRPESATPIEPPPLNLEPPVAAPKPKRPKVPDNLKQANQKERQWLRERWIQIADHLANAEQLIRLEHRRLQSEYAGPQGSLMMVNRWETLAKLWAESGELQDFTVATGNPEAVTLAGLFSELERSSRVSSQLIGSIETWTGCKPDPTRYQPPTPHPHA